MAAVKLCRDCGSPLISLSSDVFIRGNSDVGSDVDDDADDDDGDSCA